MKKVQGFAKIPKPNPWFTFRYIYIFWLLKWNIAWWRIFFLNSYFFFISLVLPCCCWDPRLNGYTRLDLDKVFLSFSIFFDTLFNIHIWKYLFWFLRSENTTLCLVMHTKFSMFFIDKFSASTHFNTG
jgi:hypothetical protein